LTRKHRDQLLDAMADEVCAQVLANNDAQNETLTAAVAQSPGMVEAHQRLMTMLTDRANLDRELEALPTDSELDARQGDDRGLTRPELAVLLAFTKNLLAAELVRSPLSSDPTFDGPLLSYFPGQIKERYPALVLRHPLRAELVATVVANQLVNRGGISMVHRLTGETSATVADIARAHTAASRIYDLDTLWTSIAELDHGVPADVRTRLQLDVKRLGERAARWLLRNETQPIDIEAVVATYSGPVGELHDIVTGAEEEPSPETLEKVAALTAAGVPDDLARRVEATGAAFGFLELSQVASRTKVDLEVVAAISSVLDEELELSWLRQLLVELPRTDYWETMARGALRDEFFREHAALTAVVLEHDGSGDDRAAEAAVGAWLRDNAVTADRCRQTFADIKASGVQDLARVSVAVRSLSQLTRG
jgi:glutamate dehydrogenase